MYTLVSGSNCRELDFDKEIVVGETLEKMGDGEIRVDVEEGEISDSASVEEISEEDFKQEARVSPKPKVEDGGSRRVWTMQDLYQYQVSRGYPSASGLHNLAWAQAVQNKPLNEIFVMDVDPDEGSKRLMNGSGKVEKVVIDDSGDEMGGEKEEGELEEGEIDLDSEPAEKDEVIGDSSEVSLVERVRLIREELGNVTVVGAEESFEGVCSQLQSAIQRVQNLEFGSNASEKESLVQLSFTAVQVLKSVFSSMDHDMKEKNKDIYSRLLSAVKSNDPHLFSSDQMKKLEITMTSPESLDVLLDNGACNRGEVAQIKDAVNQKDCNMANASQALSFVEKLPLDSLAVEPLVHNNQNILLDPSKQGFSNFRGRGILVPLLDLHKDHDADSLPSPTREAPPSFPSLRTPSIGNGIDNMEFTRPKVSHNSQNSAVHPYETDAVRAVSSYQQKFNRSSYNMFDRLPSPTPSEESESVGGDVSGEVSSSFTNSSLRTASPPPLGRPVISLPMDSLISSQGRVTAGNAASASSLSNPTMKPSAKSRDPRLRFANSDAATLDRNQRPLAAMPNTAKLDNVITNLSSRKQKPLEEPVVDGPALKRQKNGLEGSGVQRDVKPSSGTGGWLDDTDSFGPMSINRNRLMENSQTDPRKIDKGPTFSSTGSSSFGVIGANNQIPVTAASTAAASLPALLKDIAVNPTMLLSILKMGQQQRLAEETQLKSSYPATPHPISSKSAPGTSANATSSKAPSFLPKPAEPLQDPSPIASTDESGKNRMKPRDPRRVLHGNTVQNNGSLASEQLKSNGTPTSNAQISKGNVIAPKSERQTEINQIRHVSAAPPDIARQFTNSLKNIANIMSVSQELPNPIPPAIPQTLSSQLVQTKLENLDSKPSAKNLEDNQNKEVSAPDVAVGPSSENSWGDVDLLFEGYDDHQKAAIQRERARRIEEQNKMFAAHKLCLVLDLDHTLLNSAKFGEVDPIHDEILRKKEEQDREKPHRHLFRFPHMGMWTKLRPGIWTFLERASKIFELHLYTMGNKVYATEMAKILDPKGVLFAGRVISKGDDGDPLDGDDRVPKIKDLEGVLGMESCVLIIDDSIRVWPHNKLNLIVVERYTYFPCSRRQFGLSGPSLLEIDHDERPEDGTIASCLGVIERIHQNFFSNPSLEEVDVRTILASEQRKILANCRIVFSRVFPVGEANPHLHPLWQTAEQFGAFCTNQIDEQVTHVVANSLGTDKVNWALSTGRFVVYPGWVEASALLYRRANEQDFSIKT